MSSLQKFHRRTNGGAPPLAVGSEAPVIGAGWWLGTAGDGISKMYVAPKSTETYQQYGSYGTYRSIVNQVDGLTNTNTLNSYATGVHPAANYVKSLTTGGYNTWYLPAKGELTTMCANKTATPFSISNGLSSIYLSSTEFNATTVWCVNSGNNVWGKYYKGGGGGNYLVRAIRRATI
jgi:hypothetical protein